MPLILAVVIIVAIIVLSPNSGSIRKAIRRHAMQNPGERDSETRLRDTVLPPFEPLQDAHLEPIESAETPYRKEPLFNKKVMLVWAIGAAVVWFAVSFVLPIAFESAKSAIVQSIKEAEGTGSNVII